MKNKRLDGVVFERREWRLLGVLVFWWTET